MTDKLYRPANGSEGYDFIEHWCGRCRRDDAYRDGTGDSCPIVANSLAFGIEHPDYPREWNYDDDGVPRCTAFEAEDGPAPRCDKTLDMFADTAK